MSSFSFFPEMFDRPFCLSDQTSVAGFAKMLSRKAQTGDIFALEGPLGIGKTFFARAFISTLATFSEEIVSPTFTLVQTYETPVAILYHFDLYRLKSAEEALELNMDEAFYSGISLIEWPDRLGSFLPAKALTIKFAQDETTAGARYISLTGSPAWKKRLEEGGIKKAAFNV